MAPPRVWLSAVNTSSLGDSVMTSDACTLLPGMLSTAPRRRITSPGAGGSLNLRVAQAYH